MLEIYGFVLGVVVRREIINPIRFLVITFFLFICS